MSRKSVFLALLSFTGLGGTLAAGAAGPFFAEEPPAIAGQPYSAVSETQSTTVFADGNRIVRTNTAHYFRDTQGRTRVERSIAEVDGAGPLSLASTTIYDPAKSERYMLNPRFKTAVVLKVPEGGAGGTASKVAEMTPLEVTAPFALLGLRMGVGATARTESASETTALGQKVVNGVLANGTRLVRTIPAGVLGNEKPIISTLERWVSPELQVPVQITETSSIGGTVVYNLEQISRGDPDPALFAVPADYTRQNVNFQATLTATAQAPAAPASATTTLTVVKKP